jgi:serine/threonine protein kinase
MKRWALDHADFELQRKIGSGGFADVFLGYQRSTRKIVAVKKLHNEEFTESAFEMFRREIEIFAALNHFAVLPFVGVCTSPPYYIITEYMSGGCLFKRIHTRDGGPLDPTKRTIIALGIAYAMEYVHSQKMLHRDLKSLNILLDADDYPKVCDFGMSREIAADGKMTGGVGTVQWMAPEVLNSAPYDERSDVYSFGIMLWEILTNSVPFRGQADVQVAMKVVGEKQRPPFPPDCPPRLRMFINVCWDDEPKARPPFTTIVKAIESGEVVFPGTNMNAVRAYVTRFAKKAAPEPAPAAAPAPSGPENLVKKLATPEAGAALRLIRKQIGDPKFLQQLQAVDKLMPNLIKACESCNSADMAADILAVFSGIAGGRAEKVSRRSMSSGCSRSSSISAPRR